MMSRKRGRRILWNTFLIVLIGIPIAWKYQETREAQAAP